MITESSIKNQMKSIVNLNISSVAVSEVYEIIDMTMSVLALQTVEALRNKKTATDGILQYFSERFDSKPISIYIPKTPLIREFKLMMGPGYRMTKDAEIFLHDYIAKYISELAELADQFTMNANRKTISVIDIDLAHREILIG